MDVWWQLFSTGVSSLALAFIIWLGLLVINAFVEMWLSEEMGTLALIVGLVAWIAANGFLFFLRST
jgi:hypothetical protein